MPTLALVAVLFVRLLAALVGAWQVIGMLSALTWLSSPAPIPSGNLFLLLIKATVLAVCLAIYLGLRPLSARLRSARAKAK